MLRSAVLLLGLVSLCRAEFAPPTVNVSLDEDPEVRWKPLLQVIDPEFLKEAAAQIIDNTVPKWVHRAIEPVVAALENYIPAPYAGEIRGLASQVGGSVSDVIILNFAYEITANAAVILLLMDWPNLWTSACGGRTLMLFALSLHRYCTSIIAQDTNGHVYHGRNLDYHPILRNLTVNIDFLKDGKVAYRGTSFAGYVGLWTGQSPNKFTVSGDQRGTERWWNWWKNVVSAVLFRRSPVSWLVRETLEQAENFEDAVMRLAKIPIITGVYYIVGGVKPKEGVVITRERTGPLDIWPLEPSNGGWYRVETNFDHWLPPPAMDHRREAANKALNATGQDRINMDTLYQVLSLQPVCNRNTIYTTTMSAATPEEYNTLVRPEGC